MRAYIPPNFDDDGGFFWGLVKKRNAIEAGAYLGILYILFKIFINILPPIFMISALLVLGFAGGFFLIIGFDGRSLTEIFLINLKYQRTKCVATLRKPSLRR